MAIKKKQNITYNRRTWLNPLNTASSGAVVACAGDILYGDTLYKDEMFLEVSSCHCSARIHRAGAESKQDFIKKLKLLETEITKFRKHLEKQHGNN